MTSSSRAVPPQDLSSRLANVSDDPTERNTAFNQTLGLGSGPGFLPRSEPHSNNLTRSNSGEDSVHSGQGSPNHAHIDEAEFVPTSRVPSYSTAVRTRAPGESAPVPDYQTALSAPNSPPTPFEHGDEHMHSEPDELTIAGSERYHHNGMGVTGMRPGRSDSRRVQIV